MKRSVKSSQGKGGFTEMKNLRILIVDDHDVVREGVRGFLSRRPGFKICGEAANGPDAIQKTSVLKPDIVVIDLRIPDIDGMEVTRRIRKICPQTEVVILTMYGSDEYVRGAMSAGALGFVLKTQTGRDLAVAIELASQQRHFVSAEVAKSLRTAD